MHVTEAQWDKHPSFSIDLAALLNTEVLQIAFQMVIDKAMMQPSKPEGATLTEWKFMLGSKREGCFETIQYLRQLAVPPATRPPGKKPWESDPPKPEPMGAQAQS